jgi:virulence factor Mce-like protein
VTANRGVVRRTVHGVSVAALSIVLSSCATGLDSLPLPARNVSGGNTFELTVVFDNALNLPDKAKVKLNGADIGEVTAISARDFAAYVTMRINSDVPIYRGSTAQLRSATPLGDVFVAVNPVSDAVADTARLHNGDTIPLSSTSAAATVEEVLTSASLLVNGGTVRRLVTVLNGAGNAVGGKGDQVATLLAQSNEIVGRLNLRSGQLRSALQSTNELSATLSARQDTFDAVIAAAGPATSVVAGNVDQITQLTDTVAGITRQLSRFPSIQGTDTRGVIADVNRVTREANEIAVDPNLSVNTQNRLLPILMTFTHSSASVQTGEFTRIALGNHPDMNYPGDPASHGPDGTDWHSLIGSLRYEWNLLVDKIYGPKR